MEVKKKERSIRESRISSNKKKVNIRVKHKDSRIWWKWYLRGAVLWILVIVFLCYLICFHSRNYIVQQSNKDFIDVVVKCMVVATILGLFLYFLILQNYYLAVDKIMNIFSEDAQNRDKKDADPYEPSTDMNLLIRSINRLVTANSNYKSKLEKQKGILFENFLMRLMKGQIRSEMVIRQSCKEFGLDINSKEFLILLFSVEQEDPMDDQLLTKIYAYLREIVNGFVQEAFNGYLTDIDGMVACMIMSATDESLESINSTIEIERIAKLTRQILFQKYKKRVRVCVSRISRGILGCENAFSEVEELLQYARIVGDKKNVLFYSDIKQTKLYGENDYLWFKLERKFTNCINAEDYKEAAQVFEELMDNEYISNAPTLQLASCRLFGLLNSMINALGEVRLTMDAEFFGKLDPQRSLLECKTFPELRETSREVFQKINSYSQVQDESLTYNKMMGVVDYLKDHYTESELSIVSVADYFNTNASYLSRTFKKTMGIGFSDYLQRIRIKKAMLLLQESDLTIADIAMKVGYNNTLTMNRAFKKIEGTTPGQHRKKFEIP